ncbi:LysR family transcriptional regulator [Marinospirillum alkaliphilum]|uniref:DNA-binding transcriptional regulator, LysR family n=1 Tax=Marinospirillum alkaliphilum DSM 21637 TaxID=1122209 RepID=A0A1K1YJZ9_9GAMM|nr:LysR family transcriptional regulator [Marinospirillum alkaliphilum]SFX61757.1 DNA-binding transcriptional regulator, LysR family [Marinospirillum alkaliphilum DSM 21637]
MREMNLRTLDLNLLPVLQALLQERHVSHAAEQLNMSQPAVSRALARLREALQDPLLVRTSRGYDLSSRARQLQPQLNALLQQAEQLIQQPGFDPATDTSLIRLTGLDLELAIYFPPLVQRLRQLAPGLRLETVRQELDTFDMLDRDEVQFSFSGLHPATAESNLHRMVIDEMPMRCIMAADHPLAGRPLTVEAYAAAAHGMVSITGKGPGSMDLALAELGLQRQVMLRLSSFMSVADFCEHTDLIFTLPLRLAERIGHNRALIIQPLPAALEQPPVTFYLYWHSRHHRDPRMIWIREQLLAALHQKNP